MKLRPSPLQRVARVLSLLVVTTLAACSSNSDDAASPKGDGGGGGGGDNELAIVSLSSTSTKLTGGTPTTGESSTTSIVAIVTDTRGLDSIAGGTLLDENGATYAAFVASADKSTFTASLTWDQVTQAVPITYDGTATTRKFIAKFFDNRGGSVTSDIKLDLACRDADGIQSACSGKCVNKTDDGENCGACGKVCKPGFVCDGSQCETIFSCYRARAAGPGSTCAQMCRERRQSCGYLRYSTYETTPDGKGSSCNAYPNASDCTVTIDRTGQSGPGFSCLCN